MENVQCKKVLHFTFPLKIRTFLKEIQNETHKFYDWYTFQFKKALALLKYNRI